MLGRGSAEYGGPPFFWYTYGMNVEILYSPYEEALNTGLQLGSEHKIMPDGDWIQHIRRETERKDLFVYHHAYTGMFVLAHWIYPPDEVDQPICLELDTMEKPPDRGGWIPTMEVKFRCRAIDPEQKMIENQLRANNEERRQEREENLGRRTESVESLKRQGKYAEARTLEHANVHYSDEDTEIKETLRDAAKNRIITHG